MSLLTDAASAVLTGGTSPIIQGAFDLGSKLIDRFVPDPQAAAKAKQDLAQMAQNGELAHLAADTDLLKGQMAINQAEAANNNIFVAGWRPFVGWVCGSGLAYAIIFEPLMTWTVRAFGLTNPLPVVDIASLTPILLGMLGLGAMRSYEKVNGINAGH